MRIWGAACWFVPPDTCCETLINWCVNTLIDSTLNPPYSSKVSLHALRCDGHQMSPQNCCKGRQRSGCAHTIYIMISKIRIYCGRCTRLTLLLCFAMCPPPPVGNMAANVNVNQSKIDYRKWCSLRRETFAIHTNSLAHYLLIRLKCLAHLITRYSTNGARMVSVRLLIWATHEMHLKLTSSHITLVALNNTGKWHSSSG